jgi:lysozyme
MTSVVDHSEHDPSLAFLNRLITRISSDGQFRLDLARCAERGDSDGVWSLLEDPDLVPDGCVELSDDWLEEIAGGRGGWPLALALVAGALGSGQALPQLDPASLAGLALLAPGAGRSGFGDGAGWLSHALPLIREFEGLAEQAYLDPVGIPTIGYGTIRYPDGQAVQLGDRISAARAEQLLRQAVEEHYAPALFAAIPAARRYSPRQQAALVSFTYNVGVGALQRSTLRRRLLAGEDPNTVIAEELPRWSHGDGRQLPGLVRRRAAEVALFHAQAG